MAAPATVDEYLSTRPPGAVAHFEVVRRLIRSAVPGVEEGIRYQMPVFGVGGRYIVHVAVWARHIGLYPVPPFDGELERSVAPLRSGKDTVRILLRQPVPVDVVERLLAELVRVRRTDES